MTRSNSHSFIKFDDYSVKARGIDTASFSYDLRSGSVADVVQATRVRRGGLLESDLPDGCNLLQLGPDRMQWEGRVSSMLTGDSSDRTLYSAADVADGQDVIWARVCDSVGLSPGGTPPAAVRRADLAVDVGFGQRMGSPFIAALQALDLGPRYKVTGWQLRGIPETAGFHTAKRRLMVLRAYDKDLERDPRAVAGVTIRLERPYRMSGKKQWPVAWLAGMSLGKVHSGALGPLVKYAKTVRVLSSDAAVDAVLDACRSGAVPLGTADQLIGYIGRRGRFVAVEAKETQTDYRRRVKLRELGIVVSPWEGPELELPVGQVLAAAAGSWD